MLKIWGDYACFTRPEMKAERVSYDVITPSSARGILEAIYWKPAIVWVIDRIHVINPIKWDNLRRNERFGNISEQAIKSAMNGGNPALYQDGSKAALQRASLMLRDVCYVIEAHFELTDKLGAGENAEKHYNIAIRRMSKGQCFHHPYLGCREFPANFELVTENVPVSWHHGETDLGYMLYDIDFANEMNSIFYRARMIDGVIDVQKCLQNGGVS